jgi:hypothetical protein
MVCGSIEMAELGNAGIPTLTVYASEQGQRGVVLTLVASVATS